MDVRGIIYLGQSQNHNDATIDDIFCADMHDDHSVNGAAKTHLLPTRHRI